MPTLDQRARLRGQVIPPASVGSLNWVVSAAQAELINLEMIALRWDHARVVGVLRKLAYDGPWATAVALRSYWHANGFAKLVLGGGTGPESTVRLHVWPKMATATDVLVPPNIHSHRWAFASVVLAGGLKIDNYDETNKRIGLGSTVYRKYAHERSATGTGLPLRLLDEVTLVHTRSHTHTVGDLHSGDTEVLHKVTPVAGDLTATVFITGPSVVDSAKVYQIAHQAERADRNVRGSDLSSGDVALLASMLLEALEA
jgi:hypothetical protein